MGDSAKKGNWNLIICAAIIILAILYFFHSCNGSAAPEVIKTPAASGIMTAIDIENTPIVDTLPKNGNLTNTVKTITVKELEPDYQQAYLQLLKENESLDNAFRNANDSLQQVIYKLQIQPKRFSKTWETDTLKATVSGIARGDVKALQLNYTIKSRSIPVPAPKQTVFRLLGGVEAGITKDLSRFNTKVNLGFQNKKGDVISIGADTDQRFYVGYSFSIFTIKR